MAFPLRLTPFEEYMFADDRPEYPMLGFFRLRFSALLDAAALESSLQATLSRHPLTTCKILRKGWRYFWIPDENFRPKLECFVPDASRNYPEAKWIDPTAESCTRSWLIDRGGKHELVVQIHHAVIDALGMCQFIEDLLVDYARRAGIAETPLEPRPLDPGRLPHRNRFGLTWRNFTSVLPPVSLMLDGAKYVLKKPPTPLLPEPPAGVTSIPLPSRYPTSSTDTLSADETRQILAAAKRQGCTVNDLLARDLFLAMLDLRVRSGCETDKDWLRLAMPVNLRGPGDEKLSVANVISVVFIARSPSEMADRGQLLRSLQRQMRFIKDHRLSLTFALSLAIAQYIPGHIYRNARKHDCWATGVFSNLGMILKDVPLPRREGRLALGSVTLDELEFIPPMRPRTAFVCAVYTYAGRLYVLFHCDPRMVSPAQAEEFRTLYLERIRQSIQAEPGDAPADAARPKVTHDR